MTSNNNGPSSMIWFESEIDEWNNLKLGFR